MEDRKKIVLWGILFLLSCVGYFGFSHLFFRTDHLLIFSIFSFLFIGMLLHTFLAKKFSVFVRMIFWTGLVYRLLFLIATPRLSDDFFRFTWDGELNNNNISVFQWTPQEFIETSVFSHEFLKLHQAKTPHFPDGMNSHQYYSIYPFTLQPIFSISAAFGSPNEGNLIWMRLFILLAECISFLFLRKLLRAKDRSLHWTALYWLNPLVILEFTGNLHFEAVAICFLLLSLYFLTQQKVIPSALSLVLAIGAKLTPLFLVGAVFQKLNWKNFILFSTLSVGLSTVFLLWTVSPENFEHFFQSVRLYFERFGFNSGLYNGLRELLYRFTGIDFSDKISLVLSVISFGLMAYITLSRRDWSIAERLLYLYTIYLLCSPIVHPWYVLMLVPFGIISGKYYPILWSFLAFFSYGAYTTNGVSESILFTFVEWILVVLFMWKERHLMNFIHTKTARLL